MSKRKVSEEFKKQCVESYHRRGNRSAESVAAELDVGKSTLAKWVKEAKIAALGMPLASKSEIERMLQLEKENQLLKYENAFLKKISSYLAKEVPGQETSDGRLKKKRT